MRHHEILDRLDDFVDRRMAREEARRISEHLAGCEACRQEHAALLDLLARAGDLPREMSGSIRIRVETIDYFLRRYREDLVKRREHELEIEAQIADLERRLRQRQQSEELEQEAVA